MTAPKGLYMAIKTEPSFESVKFKNINDKRPSIKAN